ncbi:ephrin type-A receptor 7-like [Porites lutea]|uniref:ephrin type-A receptor 7-like n=1 Tax=Porites lutea TaxID=51062 RepID=UPI003CC65A29
MSIDPSKFCYRNDQTFLMVCKWYFWSAIFATVALISWSSAEYKVLYQTPNDHWNWHPRSNSVPGISEWSYSPGSNLYSLCSILDSIPQEPNNWLLSTLIDIQRIQRVQLTIFYTIDPPCSVNPNAKFCNDSFDVFVWESDIKVTADKIPNPINSNSSYRKLVTISGPTGSQRTLLTIPLQAKKQYIVLGFHDKVGCEVLYSVKVTNNVCPATTLQDNLVYLPETVAPSRLLESIPVEGMCTADSSHIQGSLNVWCESSGQWNASQFEGKCVCNEDMENIGGTCSGCSEGTYNNGKGLNCTVLPSNPRNITALFVNQSSAVIRWLPPVITGGHIFYEVECKRTCEINGKDCAEDTCDDNAGFVFKDKIYSTKVMIPETTRALSAYVNYTCKIIARNRVSEMAKRKHKIEASRATISFRTKGSVPGKPKVSVQQAGVSVIVLSWELKCKNGLIEKFIMAYFIVDDNSDEQIVTTTKTKLQIEKLVPGKTYEFQRVSVSWRKGGTSDERENMLLREQGSTKRRTRELIMDGVEERNSDHVTNHTQYVEINEIHSYELKRDDIKFERLVGSGNFGEVFKATIDNNTVAVKSLKGSASAKDKQDMVTELNVMKSLKPHPHVLKLIGCCSVSDPLLIVFEYLPYGDLLGYLRKSRGHLDNYNTGEKKPASKLTAKDLLSFAWMIGDGMQYLATMKVVHRDLAARNILVGENQVCKISDFGLARGVKGDIYVRTSQARLPVKWMPPESLFHGESSTMSDVWSYGIVLWEVFTIGDSPYPGFNSQEVTSLIEKGYRMQRPVHISEELFSVLTECWAENPKERPSFQWICAAIKRLMKDQKVHLNLDEYNDEDYVNFDMIDEKLQGSNFGQLTKQECCPKQNTLE